jgi:WXG100 family type VII secretion target
VADFAELEQFEQQAQRAIDEIERQLAELARFLAPLYEQRTGPAAQAWDDYQRRWDAAAVDLQASLVELRSIVRTAPGQLPGIPGGELEDAATRIALSVGQHLPYRCADHLSWESG